MILPLREALRDDEELSFTVVQDAPLQPFPRLEFLDQPLGLPEVPCRKDLPRGEFHALGDGLCLALDLVDEPLLDGARLEKTEDGEGGGNDDQDGQNEQQNPFHASYLLRLPRSRAARGSRLRTPHREARDAVRTLTVLRDRKARETSMCGSVLQSGRSSGQGPRSPENLQGDSAGTCGNGQLGDGTIDRADKNLVHDIRAGAPRRNRLIPLYCPSAEKSSSCQALNPP